MKSLLFALAILVLASPAFAAPNIESRVKSRSYRVSCVNKDIKFVSGEPRGTDENFDISIASITVGDLDGDGNDDAVVVIGCDASHGTGRWTEGYVFRAHGAKPDLVGRLDVGDRAHGSITGIRIEDGELLVTRDTGGDGACCVEWSLTQHYKLRKSRLEEVGLGERERSADSKPLHVAALRGGSVDGSTDIGDEYVIEAKAGQTLTADVHFKSGKARLVIFDGTGFAQNLGETDKTHWEGKRDHTGRWRVLVVPDHGPVAYTLTVALK